MVQWLYLRYLNTHTLNFWTISSLEGNKGVTFSARTLLVLSSILDAARNSTSLFLLLIVSMGYGVVRPTIGPVMTRVRILTAVHFFCGVLYSVSSYPFSVSSLILFCKDWNCSHRYRNRWRVDIPVYFPAWLYFNSFHDVDFTFSQRNYRISNEPQAE